MTSPNATRANVTRIRSLESSSPRFTGISSSAGGRHLRVSGALREPPERVAALLEVRELVVARAGRAEQDDVPRLRELRRVLDRPLQGLVAVAADDFLEP